MKLLVKYIPVLLLALLLIIAWRQQWWLQPRSGAPAGVATGAAPETPAVNRSLPSLNRYARLTYTRHARDRMRSRHVTEVEVQEILEEGEVNVAKSNPADRPCPTYALEGYSHEGQHLRVVFAPCGGETRVVTCIDLDAE